MYKCLIVDDKLIQRDLMAMHLTKIGDLEVVGSCSNGLEAYQTLMKQHVDIVFSDINMPELNGLDLLKSLSSSPVFVFISDYPEYAAESYSLDVVDYIVKPVTFERLLKAVNKSIEYIELKRMTGPHKEEPLKTAEDHFFIRVSSDIVKLRFEEVAYIESMGNFSKIFMVNGKHYMALVILKNLEQQLPESIFTRVHKQYIINHQKLSSIGASEIVIAEKHTIPLSQSYRQIIMDKVVQHKIVNRKL